MKEIEEKLEFYVLNYDINKKKVVHYNVFNNVRVREATIELIDRFYDDELMSFEDFVEELTNIVRWQEWSRREYEISVGDAFETDSTKLEKWDCFQQFEPNAEVFAHYLLDEYM